jgi:hypothetical protein
MFISILKMLQNKNCHTFLQSSVADPDPVGFGPFWPGTGSGSGLCP